MSKTKLWIAALAGTMLTFSANAALEAFRVNGELVSVNDQKELIETFVTQGAQRTPQLEERVKRILTRDAVIMSVAKRAKVDHRPNIKRAIENSRKTILANAVIADWLKQHPINEADIRALFETEKHRWGSTEVQVRHILVKEEKTARSLLESLDKGKAFEELAKTHSIDTQQNRDAGGLIGWTSPNVFDRDFASSLNLLKPGETLKHPIKTSLGWHIVRLEGRRPAERFANFEQHKQQLGQLLMQKNIQSYIDEEIKKAKITSTKQK